MLGAQMFSRSVLASSCVALVLLFGAPSSSAATAEQHCIAAGTVAPIEVQGYTFNHHPERKREARATDDFFAPFQIETTAVAVIPRLPDFCAERYRQLLIIRLQYKASKGGPGWHSLSGWRQARPLRRGYEGPPPPDSRYAEVRAEGESLAMRHGCAVASRMQLMTEILDEQTDAIVAKRMSSLDIPVDGWFRARCSGKVSIRDLPRLRPCGNRASGAVPGSASIATWNVRARGASCGRASVVAQAAMEAPSFSQGLLRPARIEGWQCYFAHVSAVDCIQGQKRVFVVARRSHAERCKEKSPVLSQATVLGVECDAVKGIAAAVAEDPRTDLHVLHDVEGTSWDCSASRALGYDDRMTNTYHCFADGQIAFFKLADSPERLVPEVPSEIPPQVNLPPQGSTSFPRTPAIKFFYQPTYGDHKITIPLEAGPELAGRQAVIRIKVFAVRCLPLTDGEGVICRGRKRAGEIVRRIKLTDSRAISVRVPRRGDWIYLFTAQTQPFVSGGTPFTAGLARRGAAYYN